MTVSDIIDTYGEYLSKEDIEKIEGSMSSVTGMDGDVIGKKMKYYTEDVTHRHMENMSNVPHLQGSYGGSYAEDWTVHHCE